MKNLKSLGILPLIRYTKKIIRQQRRYNDTPSRNNHFEVERKFAFDPSKVSLLETNRGKKPFDKVGFLSEKTFTDVYYDNHSANYPLTSDDIWLRQRDDMWECKTPVNLTASMDSYNELKDTDAIKEFLNKKLKNNHNHPNTPCEYKRFKEFLFDNYNLAPFCTITTRRRSYLLNGNFTMDLDTADFGHSVGEIELIVESRGKIQDAEKRIALFMKEHDWFFETEGVVMGKLTAYISRFNQNQWECMKKSGLVKRKLFPETLENIVSKAS
jgi:thiamine-triphosphatase